MKIYSFNSYEEMMEHEERSRRAADAAVLPQQAALKPGDHFLRLFPEERIVVWGQVLDPIEEEAKCGASPSELAWARQLYSQPHMKYLRFTRCFSQVVPDGELGNVHVATIAAGITKEAFEEGRANGWPSDLGDVMLILRMMRPEGKA